jgi:predicted amidohydrolase
LSIQDIDKRIDDKVRQSIQNIDTLSIQDIDNRINESIADGDIKDAIANSYKAAMGQFNGLLEEMQELKKQLEELQSNPPAAVPNPQPPITNDELIEILGVGDIARGQIYNFESLKEDGIIEAIKENQELIEGLIGDNLTLKDDLSDMNKILKFMGLQIERTTKDNKKYNRVKMPK